MNYCVSLSDHMDFSAYIRGGSECRRCGALRYLVFDRVLLVVWLGLLHRYRGVHVSRYGTPPDIAIWPAYGSNLL